MNRILSRRIIRELRMGLSRYVALFLLIVIGMSIVVGFAAASEIIVHTVERNNSSHLVEDGEFSTFVPLDERSLAELENAGVTIEKSFYLDCVLEDGAVLRIFQNRERVNLLNVQGGRAASAFGEIVVEGHFAESHRFQCGSTFGIGDADFLVTGTGCVPDYNYVKKTVGSIGANSALFGVGFVTQETYTHLVETLSLKTDEEYSYSFLLNGSMTVSDLKSRLSGFAVDWDAVENAYLLELFDRANNEKNKLVDGVDALVQGSADVNSAAGAFAEGAEEFANGTDEAVRGAAEISKGAKTLRDGLKELADSAGELEEGAGGIFDAVIDSVENQLASTGFALGLDRENYAFELNRLLASGGVSAQAAKDIEQMLAQINQSKDYYEGMKSYAAAQQAAFDSADGLAQGTESLSFYTDQLLGAMQGLNSNSQTLLSGRTQVFGALLAAANQQLGFLGLPPLTKDNYAQALTPALGLAPEVGMWLGALDNFSALSIGLDQYVDGVNDVGANLGTLSGNTGDIANGSAAMKTGLGELKDGGGVLLDGASQMFDAVLLAANDKLREAGLDGILTRENYLALLTGQMKADAGLAAERSAWDALKQLQDAQGFYDGLAAYTNGVGQAYDGAVNLSAAAASLASGLGLLKENASVMYEKGAGLQGGAQELQEGLLELQGQVDSVAGELGAVRFQNLAEFAAAEANPRIHDYKEDALINRNSAIITGALLSLLIAYIMAIFMMDNIDRESRAIGTLLALGHRKNTLLKHYLALPSFVAAAGGVSGTFLGFFLVRFLSSQSLSLYSYPALEYIFPPAILAYGIFLPTALAFCVNCLAVGKKLSLSPLCLLRKEQAGNMGMRADFDKLAYVTRFRLRQTTRELRGHLTFFAGVFLSVLLMLLGFTIQASISNMKQHIADDVRYNYQYILKFPPEEAPAGAAKGFIRNLDADFPLTGGNIEVTVLGLEEGDSYFDAVLPKALNEITISDSAQQKFGWEIGDKIVLADEVENRGYAFTVKDVTPYAAGLYVFLGIENMRTLFGEKDAYYNTLFSSESLDIESGRIHSAGMKEDIQSIADIFMDMLRSLIVILLGASVLLFMLVMFLLMKMGIDKSSVPISLMKVFGYSEREVRKLYLGSNLYILVLTAAVSIPLGKMIVDRMYPVLVSNVSLGFDVSIPLPGYALIIGIVFASYFGVDALLRSRLRHILPALVLKERE